MTKAQQTFIAGLKRGDHSEAPYRSFERFCEMAYCALAKPQAAPKVGAALEARYMRQVKAIGKERTRQFADLLGVMSVAIAETGDDFLSAVAMSDEVRASNPDAGQFFTPKEVSRMMALMILGDVKEHLRKKPYMTVAEPASGAGGMILAVAQVCRDQGIDVTRHIWFDGTDVAALCYWMTFIQMALARCSGIARQDDTLVPRPDPEWALTPCTRAFVAAHGWPRFGGRDEWVQTGLFDEGVRTGGRA